MILSFTKNITSWISNWISLRQDYLPKIVTCFKEGYSFDFLLKDLGAGITIGVLSLPLVMAFAIASGVDPERGLYTAIAAGFVISLLGGSRVQIAGPTGAFVVIIYDIVQRNGYEGLAIATVIAGILIIAMGIFRAGILLKFIPYPVTTGFTTGIAVCIFSSQIKDFFGLQISELPIDFIEKWHLYWTSASTWNPWAFSIGLATLLLIIATRYFYPRIPAPVFAVILATALVYWLDLPIQTIAQRYGEIPDSLPSPTFPKITLESIRVLFPDAVTIALLAAIESLLSAVIADGMTGHRHRSNCELVAQGLGNICSVIFGGIPATGAIARTAANVNMQAKSPISGMTHAVVILILMSFFASYAGMVPLPCLAAVLIFVAYNMSELPHFIDILKGSRSESIVLLLTFTLTVLIDITVAVQFGVMMAAVLFLKKTRETTTINTYRNLMEMEDEPKLVKSDLIYRKDIPKDVTVFEIDGPFFFGVADMLNEALRGLPTSPKFFILRFNNVPSIDTTGIHAIEQFLSKCKRSDIQVLISGMRPKVELILIKSGLLKKIEKARIFAHLEDALSYSRSRLNLSIEDQWRTSSYIASPET